MPFNRTLSGKSFEVFGVPFHEINGTGIISPAPIMDLKADRADLGSNKVTLQWTAVGDILDKGTASRYEIQIANKTSELKSENCSKVEEDVIVDGTLTSPKAAGNKEVITFEVPMGSENSSTYYFSVRAIASSGMKSDQGNIVPVRVFKSYGNPPRPDDTPPRPNYIMIGLFVGAGLALLAVVLAGTVVKGASNRKNKVGDTGESQLALQDMSDSKGTRKEYLDAKALSEKYFVYPVIEKV